MKKSLFILGGVAIAVASVVLLSGCRSIPTQAVAISNFDADKYLGKWFEIARLDFKFEKDLNNVTANYSMAKDGKIEVVNRGYHTVEKVWKESVGKAKFRGSELKAELEVSFFGPFYSGYNVIAVDKDYNYALVVGKNTKYMWILSRTKSIPADVKEDYLKKAKSIGIEVDDLVWVHHD